MVTILTKYSDKSFDEYNICQFCFRQNEAELSLWSCVFCFKDHPILYILKTDFIPMDKIELIEKLNGPKVWDLGQIGYIHEAD